MSTIFTFFKNLSFVCITICFLGISQAFGQQKYELKENTFFADGKAQFTLTEMDNSKGTKDVILKNLQGQRVILFETKEAADGSSYYELHFLTNNSVAEISKTDLTAIGKIVVEAQLLTDGKLNLDAERKFMAANEAKFSKPSTK